MSTEESKGQAPTELDVERFGNRSVERIRSDEIPVHYANSVQVETSNWDLKLSFGRVLKADGNVVVVRDILDVYMSPQHAKATASVLNGAVERWEREHGVIQIRGAIQERDK
jgi:hypothetical protein